MKYFQGAKSRMDKNSITCYRDFFFPITFCDAIMTLRVIVKRYFQKQAFF